MAKGNFWIRLTVVSIRTTPRRVARLQKSAKHVSGANGFSEMNILARAIRSRQIGTITYS